MTTLERRARLLLRAYPAGYRKDRGEEIISTLLEATPAGRSWPLARDVRALVMGGLRTRAAVNRQRTTAANLRFAAAIGAAAYLTYIAASGLTFGAFVVIRAGREPDWPMFVADALVLVAVALTWVTSGRTIRLAGPIAAAVAMLLPPAVSGVLGSSASAWPIPELACLSLLAVFAVRGERPGWRWALPVAVVGAIGAVEYLVPGSWSVSLFVLVEAIGAVSLLWAVVDARPGVATAVFLLALWLPLGIENFVGYPDIGAAVPALIAIAVAAIAVWRLRRQSAPLS